MECRFINKTREVKWKKYYPLLMDLANKVEEKLKVKQQQIVSVIFVRSKKIKEINRDYRSIDKETDVISFAYQDEPIDYQWNQDEIELGDIFINIDCISKQANDYGHSEKRELCFLFVHGLLHCHGYDHQNKKDEKRMISMQKAILDQEVPR